MGLRNDLIESLEFLLEKLRDDSFEEPLAVGVIVVQGENITALANGSGLALLTGLHALSQEVYAEIDGSPAISAPGGDA